MFKLNYLIVLNIEFVNNGKEDISIFKQFCNFILVKIDGDLMGKCGCCGDYIGGIRLNEVFNG